MKYLLRMTREVYSCFVGPSGEVLERSVGNIAKRGLDKKREDYLKRYIDLVLNSKIVSETSKIYIRSSLPSVASVITNYNDMVGDSETINIKTAQSQIDYDTRKLARYFEDTMINKILTSSSCDLNVYEKQFNLAYADYSKKNKMLTDNLVLKIPRVDVKDTCSEEQFSEIMSIIAPYFKKSIHYVESNLPESVGYLLYLMTSPISNLTFEDKERYELIKNMID
ncbi:hypothetical protein [Clostridium sp.]|uniref:hypothetical protein n=1 Tax=Clostridium sp. TaxID=1506 RepID=UPI003D6CAB52